jgi:phosphoribosylpyrophosphate synthetase
MVICYKQEKTANVIGTMELIGEVKGKNVVLVDDMIDTGGTLAKADLMMMEKGATLISRHVSGTMNLKNIIYWIRIRLEKVLIRWHIIYRQFH